METLSKLFGSTAKVKLIKLFVFNSGAAFDIDDLVSRTKESARMVKKEVQSLQKASLIKRRVIHKAYEVKKGAKRRVRKVNAWALNDRFKDLQSLQTFLISTTSLQPKEIIKKFSKAGNLKLVIIAGVFIQDPESRVDILVVGDHLRQSAVATAIKNVESEMGKEIKYAFFDTADFKYRLGIYDKLLRDILDYPHEKILNKLNGV